MGIERIDVKQERVVSAAACRAAFRIGHASLDSSLRKKVHDQVFVYGKFLTCSNLGLLETEELH